MLAGAFLFASGAAGSADAIAGLAMIPGAKYGHTNRLAVPPEHDFKGRTSSGGRGFRARVDLRQEPYPRLGTVSTKRGDVAESPSVWRILLTATFSAVSNSTNVSSDHSATKTRLVRLAEPERSQAA
jgi:hypothetical protein